MTLYFVQGRQEEDLCLGVEADHVFYDCYQYDTLCKNNRLPEQRPLQKYTGCTWKAGLANVVPPTRLSWRRENSTSPIGPFLPGLLFLR